MRRALILLGISIAFSAGAVPTQDDLRRIESRIREERQVQQESQRKAAELSGEVNSVQKQMVQLARTIQEKEESLSTLEQKQKQTRARQEELEKRLSLTDKQLVQLVTGMQTLALRPPELVFMNPALPVDMVRSQILMRHSLPVIGGINRQTRSDLAELSQVRSDLQRQIVQIRAARTQLAEKSGQMDRLLQQKSLLQAQYQASQNQARERVQALASQASDLKDLLARLEAEQKRQEEQRRQEQMRVTQAAVQRMNRARPSFRMPASGTLLTSRPGAPGGFARAYGRLAYPVRGEITQKFGETTLSGAHTKGMTITGRPRAQVISPFDGTILFAGPFKNYGQLVIIDNGDNYLTLFAGMDRINPVVGQEVLAGEPIGQMRENRPDLYIEIRKNGQPVDPEPWFARG